MRTFGYVRLSQGEPEAHGLTAQRASILERYPDAEIREEIASAREGGKRPVLRELRAQLQRGDAVVVARLDRLARSVVDFGALITESQRCGWSIVVLDQQLDTSTANGRLVANVLASVAQWEREINSERTRAALAVARARGTFNPSPVTPATRRQVVRRWLAGDSITAVTSALKLHRETVVRILRQETGQRSGRLVREVNSRVERNPW